MYLKRVRALDQLARFEMKHGRKNVDDISDHILLKSLFSGARKGDLKMAALVNREATYYERGELSRGIDGKT